jgi:hypothetical protein
MSKLIGTNPNQVPSNADLGTAAFMDKKEFLLSKGSEMSAIDAVIPKTAVDVFIYDTTKDSDGGAWRKRTQHTSWYNEKLNTTTRGSRKEFPVVAVFVAEAARVTIYDGDDINMPMWMQWNTTGALGWASGTSSVWITLTVLNGIFVWGSDNRGLGFANFIKDKIEVIHGAQRYVLKDQSIAMRETNVGTITSSSDAQGGYSFPAQNDEIYDVAATVLPNAPIDPESGLPRPTLAYAGPGGLNIITDAGDTVLITAGAGTAYDGVSWVDFTKNHNLIFEQDNDTNPRSVFCIPVPTANRTTETNDGNIADKVVMKWYANGAHEPYPVFNGGGVNEGIRLSGDNQAFKSENGDFTILEPNLTDPEQGKVAYVASDYNTGWMVGDTKLATLSDTDDTNAGAEIVTNGDFATNSDWTLGAGWTISGGKATHDSTTGNRYLTQGGILEEGKQYVLIFTISDYTSGILRIYGGTTQPIDITEAVGTFTIPFIAAAGGDVNFQSSVTQAFVGSISNVSCKLAEQDRSEYGNGLQVFGTVTKTAVATGAELVGYSGFSSSNYLRQPYNTALNFGTGSYSVMGWFKTDATNSTGIITQNGPSDSDENLTVYIAPANYGIYFDYGVSNQYSHLSQATDRALIANTAWHHFVCHVSAGGAPKIYVDGVDKQVTVSANAPSTFTFDTDYLLNIGNGRGTDNDLPFGGSIALLRISATVPSAEQIKKMYNDEKHLFEENAKATLYGDSDAVTALAYDDDTELLHVGTSAGRSVFQGLRRVDNTTDAVGAAISASNGLVAED